MATILKIPLLRLMSPSPLVMSVRYVRNRHRIARFMIMNKYQPWPKPPELREVFGDPENPADLRDSLRRKGLLPNKGFDDRQININCTGNIFDGYVPPEGDGKSSFLSLSKAKDTQQSATVSIKNLTESRKIRKFDSEFSRSKFVNIGEQIYREVLMLLPNHKSNQTRLLELVTEKGLSDMLNGLHNKTLVHEFVKHIEPPSLVLIRTQKGTTEGQLFAQITLRLFSEQVIGIYDKFGRLIYGRDDIAQDILEYVVFEKQVSEEFGAWRIHAKVIPHWLPKKLLNQRTYRQEPSEMSTEVTKQ